TRRVHLFQRGSDHGSGRAATTTYAFDDPAVVNALGTERHAELEEELGLLDVATPPFDRDAFLRGDLSPAFFGSALTNFGVEPFLEAFLDLAPGPVGRESDAGQVEPERPEFSGFVFKIQANMDPKHRDRDRKSTRLNSSHVKISYAVFCLKKKKMEQQYDRYDIAE